MSEQPRSENAYVISGIHGEIRFGLRSGELSMQFENGMQRTRLAYQLSYQQARDLRDALDTFAQSEADR